MKLEYVQYIYMYIQYKQCINNARTSHAIVVLVKQWPHTHLLGGPELLWMEKILRLVTIGIPMKPCK